jgi:hypothetical protein
MAMKMAGMCCCWLPLHAGKYPWRILLDPSVSLMQTLQVLFSWRKPLLKFPDLCFMVWCGGTAQGGGWWFPPLGRYGQERLGLVGASRCLLLIILVRFWLLVQHNWWCRDSCEFSLLVHRRLSCWVFSFGSVKFELSSSFGKWKCCLGPY